MANHGTILLDEIGEMPISLQPKLLRVLQEKEVVRLTPVKLDIRIIAATNQNLQEQIKKGTFREDLYYRLNVFPIKILPLRERKKDISILAHHFLENANKKYGKNKKFEKSSIEELECYNWMLFVVLLLFFSMGADFKKIPSMKLMAAHIKE